MRLKLYLDTSVLGAVCDPGPEDRLAATRRILDGLRAGSWDGYISALVLEEVSRAHDSVRRKIATVLDKSPVTVLDESQESVALAHAYIAAGAIPSDYEDDARHIAIATLNDINVLDLAPGPRHRAGRRLKRSLSSLR